MRVEILCVGSELLKDRVNTNSLLLARKLRPLGLSVHQTVLLPDDQEAICAAMLRCTEGADVALVSGGLGPTFDDLTREALAQAMEKKLVFVPALLKQIEQKFASIGKNMAPENARQAYIIDGAKVLANPLGTAPGQRVIFSKGKRKTEFFLLPGPPKELGAMAEASVIPALKKMLAAHGRAAQKFEQRSWHMFGMPESEVHARLEPLMAELNSQYARAIEFTILASHSIVHFYCFAHGLKNAAEILKKLDGDIHALLPEIVFGRNEETLAQAVGKILTARGKTVASAESCTGGLIAKELTDVAGSSNYFLQGVVSYSNESKVKLLRVSEKTLDKFGAVSENVAAEMALGALKLSGADFAVSTTGIAGPGGGSAEKPVGTVCFGVAAKAENAGKTGNAGNFKNAGKNFCFTTTLKLRGTRAEIREKAALTALDLLRRKLLAIL